MGEPLKKREDDGEATEELAPLVRFRACRLGVHGCEPIADASGLAASQTCPRNHIIRGFEREKELSKASSLAMPI
jgi:hypothetical protein